MAFWGVSIPGNGSYTLPSQVPPRRLRITQASNFGSNLDFLRLEVKVGENQPIPVAIGKGSKKLELEFEELDDVVFSVVGPTQIHLVGYYYKNNLGQYYPTHKVDTGIYPGSDVEPSREKSTKKVADMDFMEGNILEERLVSNEHTPKINIQGETLGNQLSEQQGEPRNIGVIVPPHISHPEPGVIVGHDDEHKGLDSSDFSINAREKEGAVVVEIARHHFEALQDAEADVPSSERENMVDKLDEKQVLADTSADEKLPSNATVCAERRCDLNAMGRTKQRKRNLVPEEMIQEDTISIELAEDDTRQVKRKETIKKKIRKVITGEVEGIIEDSSNKKKSDLDLVHAKKKKKAKKEKFIVSKHEQDDMGEMNNDTFEAPPTKVKSAKNKRKNPVTSKDPNEQSKADSAHIVLGLPCRIAPNK